MASHMVSCVALVFLVGSALGFRKKATSQDALRVETRSIPDLWRKGIEFACIADDFGSAEELRSKKVAIQEFTPETEGELGLKVGDLLEIDSDPDKTPPWVHGVNQNRKRGWFPFPYVKQAKLFHIHKKWCLIPLQELMKMKDNRKGLGQTKQVTGWHWEKCIDPMETGHQVKVCGEMRSGTGRDYSPVSERAQRVPISCFREASNEHIAKKKKNTRDASGVEASGAPKKFHKVRMVEAGVTWSDCESVEMEKVSSDQKLIGEAVEHLPYRGALKKSGSQSSVSSK